MDKNTEGIRVLGKLGQGTNVSNNSIVESTMLNLKISQVHDGQMGYGLLQKFIISEIMTKTLCDLKRNIRIVVIVVIVGIGVPFNLGKAICELRRLLGRRPFGKFGNALLLARWFDSNITLQHILGIQMYESCCGVCYSC
jgi:hypothetical protein